MGYFNYAKQHSIMSRPSYINRKMADLQNVNKLTSALLHLLLINGFGWLDHASQGNSALLQFLRVPI
jgi:hypothetical protein